LSTGPQGPPESQSAGVETEEPKPQALSLPVRLFLIPALIVVAVGVVLLLYRLLGGAEATPREILAEIESGSGHRRWQAAYELSRILTRDGSAAEDPALGPEMARLFANADGRDPRVRRYLALCLGRIGTPTAVPALIAALDDADGETRVYSAWALGAIGDTSAAAALAAHAADEDPGMRKMIAYSLGNLGGSPAARPALLRLLVDEVPDVRWNAALGLARLGDPAGREVLRQMVDRVYLGAIPDMTAVQRDEVVLNGVAGIALLGAESYATELTALAERDPNPNVRAAADRARRGTR
jgi:HEAT repeat protein